jgi:E3 ubiquitin-protein ligase RBBP6
MESLSLLSLTSKSNSCSFSSQAWIKYAKKRQNAGHGDINEKTNVPSELKCAICMRLMVDAVKVPCCQANFCDDCIRTSLVENEDPTMRFRCPVCRVDQFPDNLLDNKEIRQKVDQLLKSYFSQEGPKSASKLESPPVDNSQSTVKKNPISTGPMMIPTAQRKGRSYTIVEPLEKAKTPELGDGVSNNNSGASSKQNSSPSTDQVIVLMLTCRKL